MDALYGSVEGLASPHAFLDWHLSRNFGAGGKSRKEMLSKATSHLQATNSIHIRGFSVVLAARAWCGFYCLQTPG